MIGTWMVRITGRTVVWLATLGVLAAWVIRLTIRDTRPEYAILFYATPPSLIFGGTIIAAFGWSVRGKRIAAGLSYFAMACSFILWIGSSYQMTTPFSQPHDGLKVVYWNTARGAFGWHGVFWELQKQRPDVIAVCEAGMSKEDLDDWQAAFPQYQATDMDGQLLLLSKIPIGQLGYCDLRTGKYKRIRLDTNTGPVQLVLVDVDSNTSINRDALFESIVDELTCWQDDPMLIVGDFNTPRDSVHFHHFERRFRNAFETSGQGYAPTWPMPFPVLQIDHAWHNNRLAITECHQEWTRFSDHRPMILHVRPEVPVSTVKDDNALDGVL
ncbi:MAG: endonuclease/exonuclease/phosphatase family protein [Pirellulaceae bacterium]